MRVTRCRRCGHRVARHHVWSGPGIDYHEQCVDGSLLEALRATRVRQAGRLIELLRRHVSSLSALVDYGAGRGWFLEACRSSGVAPIAGVDTSRVSVDGLTASGIESRQLAEGEDSADAIAHLSFRPRVLTVLDVVEHFPPDEIQARLRSIVEACGGTLEIVAVKVPVAGLLYGAAASLCRAGFPEYLSQLYQAGTWPPHFNYFSIASAELLLTSAGLTMLDRVGDPDFEPDSLGSRIGAASATMRTLARIGGNALGAAIRVTGSYDSAVFLAKPSRS